MLSAITTINLTIGVYMAKELSRRFTVTHFCKKHDSFLTENALRFMLFKSDSNRMDEFKVIERLGRRVFINETNFFQWLEAINKKEAK